MSERKWVQSGFLQDGSNPGSFECVWCMIRGYGADDSGDEGEKLQRDGLEHCESDWVLAEVTLDENLDKRAQ